MFRNEVLRSKNMVKMFNRYSRELTSGEKFNPTQDSDNESDTNESGIQERYMTMADFTTSCVDRNHSPSATNPNLKLNAVGSASNPTSHDPNALLRIENTFNLLRGSQQTPSIKIFFEDYCLFHLMMARPDPEVDIAFLLMDTQRRGYIKKEDFVEYMKSRMHGDWNFDVNCDFITRFFGEDGDYILRPHDFSQFLVEFQREQGRQACSRLASKGYVTAPKFVELLKDACGWRLPPSVSERLDDLYLKDMVSAARHSAKKALEAEKLKNPHDAEKAALNATRAILRTIEEKQSSTDR